MNDNIGLVISGCKGGYRVICSNNVVEYTNPAIANTICDFRGFIRFNLTKLNVYSLEFTSSYKVFTLNRSLNDNGTGGYVAITLFVPHAFKVKNVREVLNSLMDAYFKEYVHPLYGTYIGGKFDDIKPFVQLFNNMAEVVREPRKFATSSSALDNQAQVLVYGNAPEIDEFLDSPYRKEFFQSRKVLFMSRDLYAGIPGNLRFERPEKLLDRNAISGPEPLPVLKIDDPSMVKSLEVNGSPVEYGATPIELADIDTIKVVLHRKYYEDYELSGEVGQLIFQRRGLKRDSSKVIVLRTLDIASELKPKSYSVKLTLNGVAVPESRVAVFLTRQCRGNVASKNPKTVERSEFTVRGSEFPCYLCWGLIYKGKSVYDDTVVYSDRHEDVAEAIENGGTIDLKTKSYSYAVKVEGNLSVSILKVDVNGVKLEFPIKRESEREITFDLPEDTDKGSLRFETDEKNAECKIDGDTIRIAPKPVMYRVSLGDFSLGDRVWDFAIDGKSRRESRASVKVRLRPDELKRGELTIDGLKFDYDVEGNGILPKGYIVNVKGAASVPVEYDGETHDVYRWRIFPKKPILDKDKYEVKERYEERGGLQILEVSAKRSGTDFAGGSHSYSYKNKHDDFNQDSDDFNFGGHTDRKDATVKVRLFNCQGGKFEDEAITNKEAYKNLNQSYVNIVVGGKKCILHKDNRKNAEVAARNMENGFKVDYNGMDTYTVSYNGTGKQPKRGIGDFFRSRIGHIVMLCAMVMVLAGIGLGVWLLWPTRNNVAVVCSIVIDSDVSDTIPQLANIESVIIDMAANGNEKGNYVIVQDDSVPVIQILLDKKALHDECKDDVSKYWNLISNTEIVVKWKLGEDGNDLYPETYTLNDIDDSEVIKNALGEFCKKGAKKGDVKSVSVSLKPDAYKGDEVQKDNLNSLQNYVTGLNPVLVKKDEAEKLISNNEKAFSEAEREKKADEDEKARIDGKIDGWTKRLQSKRCTKSTLIEVENEYNSITGEKKQRYSEIDKYIKAYKTFFNAKNESDIGPEFNRKYGTCFSTYQRNIIFEGYGYLFDNWKNQYGMCFYNLEHLGVVDEYGNRTNR